MNDRVLVFNCGSSSIKFALFDAGGDEVPRQPAWQGKIDGITGASPRLEHSTPHARNATYADEPIELDRAAPYACAIEKIRALAQAQLRSGPAQGQLIAVAHRVVHGGAKYAEPVRLDAEVLADLRAYVPLAPLHQPYALEAIDALLAADPRLPQIACFDTAFHRTMPQVEQMLPLPWSAWERGLRRYGFHGLSYEYQSIALPERHGELARGRAIVAHLGSGASLCAMHASRSVATTMGFSALDGLMMGTRCGALDPGAVLYLMEVEKLTLEEVAQVLYHDSGLLGVSGVSADPRRLLPLEAQNPRVRQALALYVHRIVREIGAMVAVLGGLDLLAFTAGIGEHNAQIRARICSGLGFLGLELDDDANAADAPIISSDASRVRIAVEPTNEEWIAARCAARLVP